MAAFSQDELDYLAQGHLGRIATVEPDGQPHVVPVGYRYNPELGTIDIGGRNFTATQKFRNVQGNPKVALIVDDVLPPWRPRCVMVRGTGEALEESTGPDGRSAGPIIRITPTKIVSWGLDEKP